MLPGAADDASEPGYPAGMPASDLSSWVPRLLAAWHDHAPGERGRGSADRLQPREVESLAHALLRLQRGLTGDRRLVGVSYMDDPTLLGAYLLYYWPASYTQARFALRVLDRPFPRVLDLGAGPGPLLAAAADHAIERGVPVDLVSAERSPDATRIARDLLEGADLALRAYTWDAERDRLPAGRFDLISMGWMLNELWSGQPDRVRRRADLLGRIAGALSVDGVLLLLDPASLGPSRDLLAVRDLLVTRGHPVLSPCFFQGPCPAVAREGGTCHAEIDWTMPPLVYDLALKVGLHRERLKMAWLAVGRRGDAAPTASAAWRVVSEPMVNKSGRTRLLLCGASGRTTLSAKAGEGTAAEAAFFGLRRGDIVEIVNPETRESGLGLGAGTRIRRVGRR